MDNKREHFSPKTAERLVRREYVRKSDAEKNLINILLEEKYINQKQLEAALSEQSKSGEPIGEILLKREFITIDELYLSLSRQYNIPYEKLDFFIFDNEKKFSLIGLVGQRYAEDHLILPMHREGNILTLSIFDPERAWAISDLKQLYSHFQIQCVLINRDKFEELFELLYGDSLETSISSNEGLSRPDAMDSFQISFGDEKDDREGQGVSYGVSSMEVEQVLNFIIKYGIVHGASDIHIEQDRSGPKIRFRIDGMLQLFNEKDLVENFQDMTEAIISRIKVISNLDIKERRVPQNGVFRVRYFDKVMAKEADLDFRVATCPAIVGENVTLRMLDYRKSKVGLENQNHSRHVLVPFMRLLKNRAGVVLVSGPTGSGKTSTLYGALQYIYNPFLKIITAEDPIEYSLPGIMQTQANQKIGLTFANLLRSFLRIDPDVIMVREIRDEETAAIGFDAAQTGHLLLSTVQTTDAVSAVSRLLNLNIDCSNMASGLLGVLSQRLCRKICDNCMAAYVPEEDEWRSFLNTYPDHLTFFKGEGCDVCGFSGYKGRVLISELFEVTRENSLAISRGATEREIKQIALDGGMKTLVDDGVKKLHQTTLSEIIRVIPHELVKAFKSRQPGETADSFLSVIISNPDIQGEEIAGLFNRYQELRGHADATTHAVDASLFKRFIAGSYRRITRQYGCTSVSFSIRSRDNDVKICAQPDMAI